MELQNTVALIPGASRPIGRAIAHRFADAGATLVLPCYSDWQESTKELRDAFADSSAKHFFWNGDLTSLAETKRLAEEIGLRFGALDFLINNIERGGMPVVHGSYDHECNRNQWDVEFNTTLHAKRNLYHSCLPWLKRSKAASIVNITSIAAVIGRSGPASVLFSDGYSAANRAVGSFTEQWAREAPPSLRVNEVMLGLIQGRHAENTRGWSAMTMAERRSLIDETLLKRSGTPEEVADMIYFIAVKAHYLTGSTIHFDGGYRLGSRPVLPLPEGILTE